MDVAWLGSDRANALMLLEEGPSVLDVEMDQNLRSLGFAQRVAGRQRLCEITRSGRKHLSKWRELLAGERQRP